MILKTLATLYSVSTFHSNKTNQDYNTIGLVIEGRAKSHFIGDREAQKVLTSIPVEKVRQTGEPQKVTATFDIYCGEKGWGGSLIGIEKNG